MRQSWHNLTFFHRAFAPELIQPLLPPGLQVQSYQGKAYIGFVPFWMENVRLNHLPPLPNHRYIPETNVRTYVTTPDGTPGVWFCSLDCTDQIAITTARNLFGLNYLKASLTIQLQADKTIYSGTRASNSNAAYKAEVHHPGTPEPAKLGSFEFWLAERYLLFSMLRGKLIVGQVHHAPYQLIKPTFASCHESMITSTTGLPHSTHWDSILYSPGVNVEVFQPKSVH
ncbi:MAG: YqjF family protein [Fimbriimonadaceae bacterium]